jgi:drug/metabolite transporter (DMT)-like permease
MDLGHESTRTTGRAPECELPRRAEWIAIALGGAGAAVMLLGRDLQGNIIGTLFILFGTTSWSLSGGLCQGRSVFSRQPGPPERQERTTGPT